MKLKTVLIAILLLGLASCSSSVKKSVNSDRANLSPMISKEEMIDEISKTLNSIEGLTDYQKEELRDIHAQVMTESWEINQGIREHKLLLFKYLTAKKVKTKKVNYAKKQIIRLFNKKLDLMLSSLDKVKAVMGKDADKVFQSRQFMEMHQNNSIREH
jgi:hypothetical protein